MQVAMEITTNLQLEGMPEKDKAQVAEINLGCVDHDTEHTYRVFVTTFLGFGANEAMHRHHRTVFLETAVASGVQGLDKDHRLKGSLQTSGREGKHQPGLRLGELEC